MAMYIATTPQIVVAIAIVTETMQIPIAMNIQTLAARQVQMARVRTLTVTNILIVAQQQIRMAVTRTPTATSIQTLAQRVIPMAAQPTLTAMNIQIAVRLLPMVEVVATIAIPVTITTRITFHLQKLVR